MDMTGEYRIPAPREQVWAALNDPATLKASLPGCESLEKVSDHEFAATVVAKVGPVKAKFNGNVTLSNLNPPESYTISGEGKGGAAGFAKGGADVRLTEDGEDHGADLHREGGRRRQAGAARLAPDRRHGQEDGGRVLQQLQPAGGRTRAGGSGCTGAGSRAALPAAPPESLLQNKFVWAAAAIVVLMILVLLFR